jgi:hypothetical protein
MDWNDQFAAMRSQFLLRAKDRLAGLDGAIDAWEKKLDDQELLMKVYKDFHWLSGVGGTYQLPEISALGSNGEEICLDLIDRKREATKDDANRLREIMYAVSSLMRSTN